MKPEGVTCPECGWQLTQQDLQELADRRNTSGTPKSTSPGEASVPGWMIVVAVIVPLCVGLGLLILMLANVIF
jgi:hypothetical protein